MQAGSAADLAGIAAFGSSAFHTVLRRSILHSTPAPYIAIFLVLHLSASVETLAIAVLSLAKGGNEGQELIGIFCPPCVVG
ncbi:hypothetical protein IQ238_18440 [Pleurocapsales cyanobacterium LEGE 06147]|nr:hypothetical protein [Pleurocapsales cyanobacterium LEGE 06147]